MAIPRTWQAALLLIGTIVGVGMFGIPFVFARAGFAVGAAELLLIALAAAVVHLAYTEVVLRTRAIHRLPGYVARYLPPLAGLARLSYLAGLSGALLAYVVLGGFFMGEILHAAVPAIPAAIGPALFYLLGMAVIIGSIRFEGMTNAVLTLGLAAAILVLAVTLLPHIEASAFLGIHPAEFAAPYGVLLFAMAGAAIIPDMRRLLPPARRFRLGALVLTGTLVSAFLYLVFAVAVVGAMGAGATPDAVSGLAGRFGPAYLLAGGVIGFLATITSFIGLGVVLEGTLRSDFRFRPAVATALTAAIPAFLFALGFHDFIRIIGLVGAVAIGLDSILILLIHRRAQAEHAGDAPLRIWIPGAFRALLILMFAAGIVVELAAAR